MIATCDFSLRHTIESGQPLTFYSDLYTGKLQDRLAYPTSKGRISLVFNRHTGSIRYDYGGSYTDASAGTEIRKRLGLNQNMKEIYGKINTDPFMERAIEEFHGLRITKSEPWEATICFVISQFNNIKRIRGIINNLRHRFGESLADTHKFPTAEAIAAANLQDIRSCGTGFRDRYIKKVAEEFSSSFNPDGLYSMKYETAKERLMELDGIGDKVADCILLFGYNKFEALPIDVWVKRVVEKAYFKGRKKIIRQIHEFSTERWGKYRGYAQQYIFHSGRINKIGKNLER